MGEGLVDLGHVARLAALLVGIVAVQPLGIRHLLVEGREFLAAFAEGLGDERVAGAAERRVENVTAVRRSRSLPSTCS